MDIVDKLISVFVIKTYRKNGKVCGVYKKNKEKEGEVKAVGDISLGLDIDTVL